MSSSAHLFDMQPLHPGKILRQMLSEKAWTHDELAAVTGISRQTIYMILAGKSNISAETAVRLAAALGNTAEEWIRWDGLHRLAAISSNANVDEVASLAKSYEIAPVREMVKRGWINSDLSAASLNEELRSFFESSSLDNGVQFQVATKRTVRGADLSAAETAWCFRARQLAKSMLVGDFSTATLEKLFVSLKKLAAHPKEARHVSKLLAEYGVRFLVVEPLANVKIDGAAFWIGESPVIALSMRHDRMDGFWFTLMHELAHIKNGDALSVDTGLVDANRGVSVTLVEDEAERQANLQAADSLISSTEMDSFVRRVGPLYQKARIIQFANRIRIHPGIIVGQLQHRRELSYTAMREVLVKVRECVTSTALTDGWGHMLGPYKTGEQL